MATVIDTYKLTGKRYVIEKDPNADLDYSWNWTTYLAPITDNIISATFIIEGIDALLTQHNVGFDSTHATVWLAGGTLDAEYRVTCRITTDNTPPRIDDRSIFVKIKPK